MTEIIDENLVLWNFIMNLPTGVTGLHMKEGWIQPEPVTCRQFGCGRHLTAQESLYGSYCCDHQNRPLSEGIERANGGAH